MKAAARQRRHTSDTAAFLVLAALDLYEEHIEAFLDNPGAPGAGAALEHDVSHLCMLCCALPELAAASLELLQAHRCLLARARCVAGERTPDPATLEQRRHHRRCMEALRLHCRVWLVRR